MEEPIKYPTIDELTARLDKLEQEVEWTREMVEILEEHIRDMNSPKDWENNTYE